MLLLDSTGAHEIGVAGAVGSAFGLGFVGLGVLAFMAAWRVRRFSRRMRRAVGHLRSASGGWTVGDDTVISTIVGDISLDLRDADLPEGETECAVLCWLGTIQVRVPRDVGIDVTAQAIVGSVDVLGVREEGVVRDIHIRSDGYDVPPPPRPSPPLDVRRRAHGCASLAAADVPLVPSPVRRERVKGEGLIPPPSSPAAGTGFRSPLPWAGEG